MEATPVIHVDTIFHEINHPAIVGTPITMETTIYIYTNGMSFLIANHSAGTFHIPQAIHNIDLESLQFLDHVLGENTINFPHLSWFASDLAVQKSDTVTRRTHVSWHWGEKKCDTPVVGKPNRRL